MLVKLASVLLTLSFVYQATAPAGESATLAEQLPRHFTGSLKLSSDRPGDVDLRVDSVSTEGADVVFLGYISVVNDSYRLPLMGRIDLHSHAVGICAGGSGDHPQILRECLAGTISSDLRSMKARSGQGTSRVLLNVAAD